MIPIETAIHKMTGASARALGISGRGLLREGFAADVTVFDPETVAETADLPGPAQLRPKASSGVWVNGVPVFEDGEHTGATPGTVLGRA